MKNYLNRTRELARLGVLYSPASFRASSFETLTKVCNGCGAANAKFDFVPDTIYGLRISPACNIHDWMYHNGRTLEDKMEADRVMLNNILRLIKRDKKWFRPKFLMRRRALKYYYAVKYFGGPAFWSGKDSA